MNGFFSQNNENNFYYQPILYLAHFKNYLRHPEHDGTGRGCEKKKLYTFKIRVALLSC
jgi:hypothetical protein